MPNFVKQGWTAAILMIGLLVMQGCATMIAETPAQMYYASKATYSTALAAATIWAQGPAGQRAPEVILRIQGVDAKVMGTMIDIDVSMCFYGIPTLTDRTPPPSPDCVPLLGATADAKFTFAGKILLTAAAELRRQHPDLK